MTMNLVSQTMFLESRNQTASFAFFLTGLDRDMTPIWRLDLELIRPWPDLIWPWNDDLDLTCNHFIVVALSLHSECQFWCYDNYIVCSKHLMIIFLQLCFSNAVAFSVKSHHHTDDHCGNSINIGKLIRHSYLPNTPLVFLSQWHTHPSLDGSWYLQSHKYVCKWLEKHSIILGWFLFVNVKNFFKRSNYILDHQWTFRFYHFEGPQKIPKRFSPAGKKIDKALGEHRPPWLR